jgi:vacuolar protein sorting-associated protein VTA1
MENISIPSTVPEDLRKACDNLIKRATEMKRAEPVIAYWCE